MNIKPSHAFVAVFVTFLANGALLGTWVARIPAIQTKLSLSEAGLGMALLGMSVGVLVGLSLAGGWVSRFGSRTVTVVGFWLMCLLLPSLSWAPHPILLWFLLLLFGGAMSVMDVAMNEQTVFVEREAGKPVMSRFHGAFSVGGLLGALLGSALASADVSAGPHFIVAVILFGLAMIMVKRHLLLQTEAPQSDSPVFRVPDRRLWPLGVVALISSIAEGAMADWSAVYLTKMLHATAGAAALGFAAYSLAMTVARLSGDHLKAHFSPAGMIRAGGWISGIGLLVVVLSHNSVITMIGFAIVGLGLANIIPIAFTAAGNYPGVPSGTGIAAVATIGYAGFLAGPPLIGFLAEATSLRGAFWLLIVVLAILPWVAHTVSVAEQESSR